MKICSRNELFFYHFTMFQSDKESQKEKLRAAIQERVDKEEHAFRLVEKMVLSDSVDKEFFLNAGTYITISQYKDVTEERAITKRCGYPLCNNHITQVLMQKYKISVREKKVYDITQRKNFCNNQCYKASKYFESQLSAEPVWMRERNKLPSGLKLLEDHEDLTKTLSGFGEEVLMNVGKNDGEKEHVDDEHVEYEHEGANYENDDNDDENERVYFEHENDYCDHEYVEEKHEDAGNEHGNVDDEHEDVDNGHECDDENHVYENDNNDLGCIVERIGNVKIDLDFTDSDDDIDDIDDICDDHRVDNERKTDNNKEIVKENSESCVQDSIRRTKMKSEVDSNTESSNKSTRNIPKIDKDTRSGCTDTNSGSPRNTKQARTEKEEQARKQCVDKVHQVLLEWCSAETKKYLVNSFRGKESGLIVEFRGSDGAIEETKGSGTTVIIPSIDSKSQMAIRGKIVFEKLTKAMSPMLSKLSLTKADMSSQLNCILKTFRFTNTNLVLKPSEWTLVALTLILVLVKCNLSLKRLLFSRQKDFHSLLSNAVDDEDDVDRLLDVFNFEECPESPVVDGQQQFDMEELD